MRVLKQLVLVVVLFSFTSVFGLSISLHDQGSGVKNKASGDLLSSGNLTVEIWNDSENGFIVYNETFVNAIVEGVWSVVLGENVSNPLVLNFSQVYYKDYKINGEDASFTNLTGDVIDRRLFYSGVGSVQDFVLVNQSINSGNLVFNINLSNAIGFSWNNLDDVPSDLLDGDNDTGWDISTSNYLINNSGVLDLDEAHLNLTVDDRIEGVDHNVSGFWNFSDDLNIVGSLFLNSSNSVLYLGDATTSFYNDGGRIRTLSQVTISNTLYLNAGAGDIFFGGTSDTRLYRPSAKLLQTDNNFTVSGNLSVGQNFSVDSNTLFVDSDLNRVGIGTSAPIGALQVITTSSEPFVANYFSSSGSEIDFLTSLNLNSNYLILGSSGLTWLRDVGDRVSFFNNSVEVLTIADTGNVGIGASVPLDSLHVAGAIRASKFNDLENLAYFLDPSNPGPSGSLVTAGKVLVATASSANMFEVTGNASITQNFSVDGNTLFVDSDLNRVGIGTSNPVHKLDIHTDNYLERVRWIVDTGIDSTAYVLLKSNNARGSLELGGSGGSASILHTTGGWQWNNQLNIMGNIGINTVSPNQVLDVNGSVNISGQIDTGQGLTEVHLMNQNLQTSDSVSFDTLEVGGGFGSSGCTISASGSLFCDGDITFSGTIYIQNVVDLNISGGLLPSQTATFDVGNATFQWRDFNFSGIGYIGNHLALGGDLFVNGGDILTNSTNLVLNPNGGSVQIGSGDDLSIGDNDKILVGSGSDLQIYHDGTDSFIDNINGILTIRNTGRILQLGSSGSGLADVRFYIGAGSNDRFFIADTDDGSVILFNLDTNNRKLTIGSTTDVIDTTFNGTVNITRNLSVGINTLFVNENTNRVGIGTINSDELLEVYQGNIKIGDNSNVIYGLIFERNGVEIGRINTASNTINHVGTARFDSDIQLAGTGLIRVMDDGPTLTLVPVGDNFNDASGVKQIVKINPSIDQSGTAGYDAFVITPSVNTVGSGTRTLIRAGEGSSTVFVVNSSGYTGIGRDNPTQMLDVNGSVNITNNLIVSGGQVSFDGSEGSKIYKDSNGDIVFRLG